MIEAKKGGEKITALPSSKFANANFFYSRFVI